MKCTIPGPNVKLFGRAIHSLSKIGDELYIEPLDDSLAIRTVNSSRSAYACFLFKSAFFIQYTPTTVTHSTQGDEDESIRCKITMKSCLTVFKSLSTLDKTVDKCKIHLDMKEARLVFLMHCKHGIVKTYNLSFIECETLQAVFTKDLMPNMLTAQSRLYSDAVVNFQNNQEEISLRVDPHKVIIKNYVEDEPDPSKCIRSELAMEPDEFDQYQIGVDTEVTFCLKELRAILAFSEPSNLPLSAHFEAAGKPIVFSIDGDSGFDGDFVLATLAENNSQASQQPSQAQNTTTQRISTSNTPRTVNQRRPNVPKIPTKKEPPTPGRSAPSTSTASVSKPNGHTQSRSTMPNSFSKPSTSTISAKSSTKPSNDSSKRTEQTLGSSGFKTNHNNQRNEEEQSTSPVIPPCPEKPKPVKELLLAASMDTDEDTEDEDMLPGTPPAKKFKSLFFGLSQSQSTTAGSQPQTKTTAAHQVLAEDTDEDD